MNIMMIGVFQLCGCVKVFNWCFVWIRLFGPWVGAVVIFRPLRNLRIRRFTTAHNQNTRLVKLSSTISNLSRLAPCSFSV